MRFLWMLLGGLLLGTAAADDAHFWCQTHEVPSRKVLLKAWRFDTPEWTALHDCSLQTADGALVVNVQGRDPFFHGSLDFLTDRSIRYYELRVKLADSPEGSFEIFWTNDTFRQYTPQASARVHFRKSSEPTAAAILWESETLPRTLRLDPFMQEGSTVKILELELWAVRHPPILLELLPQATTFPDKAELRLTNISENLVTACVNGESWTFEAGASRTATWELPKGVLADRFTWRVETDDFPAMEKTVVLLREAPVTADWKITDLKTAAWCTSPDGKIAFLQVHGKILGAAVPGRVENLQMLPGDGFVEFRNTGTQAITLPAIRIFSEMTYAVLPGVELLEKGEWSSSRADFHTKDHLRIHPSPNLLTQQWMGIVTDGGTVRLQWKNPAAQPEFAIPNYFDGSRDARMGLTLAPGDTARLYLNGDADSHAMNVAGTREQLRNFSRTTKNAKDPTREELFAMYRDAFAGVLFDPAQGWGHCGEAHWKRYPSAGMASAVYLLTGKVPDFPEFQDVGTHVENDTIYEVTGKMELRNRRKVAIADSFLPQKKPDGSFTYMGKYAAGHFENTALGVCVRPAWHLLVGWMVTKEPKYLAAAEQVLEYCERFQVGRGAQCWEMPLHTPDPLACAYAIRAYTLAYQITKKDAYLQAAIRWADEGLTYVYLWDTPDRPMQYGATIGVLGATNWLSPNWIGRPVQWIGTVYAFAILELADVLPDPDATFWQQVAEEITLSSERQLQPEGEYRGLLPDSVDPVTGSRFGPNINPSVPYFLRLRLERK
ncbi:MAG: hypothetical protein Q4D98_08855 [Planctomycetia bacterium]|nr:hypothetical protein [Planctomycetia bacterium]